MKKVRVLRAEDDDDKHMLQEGSTKYWGLLLGRIGIDMSVVRFTSEDNKVIIGTFNNRYVEVLS